MTCQHCGATIADKAIVCYRCGTATAIPEAAKRPAPGAANTPAPVRISPAVVLLVTVGLVLTLASFFLHDTLHHVTGVGGSVLEILGFGAFLLRLRRARRP